MLAADLTNEQRRDIARRHFESAELWLRKIIEHQLSAAYGPQYFSRQLEDGSFLIKAGIRNYVEGRRTKEPTRFARNIDATTLGQAIDIVTNPKYFNKHFRAALSNAYPDGMTEAKTFLGRLESIRNKIDHGGSCSVRELEKAVCYSNDFIDSVKAYFASLQMDRVYNVPKITRFVDSLGNESHMENVPKDANVRIIDWRRQGLGDLRPGDRLSLEIEVDQSFSPTEYNIKWHFGRHANVSEGVRASVDIGVGDVNTQVEGRVIITSTRDWHEFGAYDDVLTVIYRVLPPP